MKYLLLFCVFVAGSAHAFPEMVRHGYVNCTTCHHSPNGGGVLTPYGRQLSGEALSTWYREGETDFAYGALTLPEWVSLGGDVRALQVFRETPKKKEGRFLLMQADLEAAVTVDKFQAVGTLGLDDDKSVFSRRHYATYRPTDQMSFRAGRFFQAFGLNVADHYVATKRGLGWDQGSESYNIEGAYIGETADFFLTANLTEQAIVARSSVFLAEKFKLGASYYNGGKGGAHRQVVGPYFILGFTPRFFLLAELDFQNGRTAADQPHLWGAGDYVRLDYEVYQGMHVYLTQEYLAPSFQSSNGEYKAYGGGIQLFPRPHFSFQLSYQKILTSAFNTDMGLVLLHFYP